MARTRRHPASGHVAHLARTLARHYGPSRWWPADTAFEVMAGAILVQNTAWSNAVRALDNLRDAALLQPEPLARCRIDRLRRLIRPSGFFRQKADRLRGYARWMTAEFAGSVAAMRHVPGPAMREQLLALHGIGPETADSILCYALDHPVFVADAYARRIFARHGLTPPGAPYPVLQDTVMQAWPADRDGFGELHAHLVSLGKDYCTRRNPACDGCPLDGWHHHQPAAV